MSNFMKNARTWLGLGSDPYYDDDYADPDDDDLGPVDDYEDDDAPVAAVTPAPVPSAPRSRATASASPSPRSTGPSRPLGGDWDEGDGGVRVISAPAPGSDVDATRGVVRPLPSATRPDVVSPTTFNDVQQVADAFKRSQPVIVNLQGVDRDLSRRLIDFGSGLCYGLEGNMERVTDQVFLLTPHGAEVSDDDRRRIRDGSLVDEER
jgi:cell division inhibitor SepF